jgi:hypothetical protein
MMNNPKERHYGMESGDEWGDMNGGDCDYDVGARVGDVVLTGNHHQGQVVSCGVGRVDNIDVLVAY